MRILLAAALVGIAVLAQRPALAAAPALDLQVELDPAAHRLEAVAVVIPAERDFRFELYESLAVHAASVNGKMLAVVADGRKVRARLARAAAGRADHVRLEYGGTLPALDRNLDYREVLGALPPMVSDAGSFLPAGAAWYPQPAPRFTYRVSLSVPADQRALVPGRLASEALPAAAADRYRASFEFADPVDGIALMAGPWTIRERMMPRADGTPLRLRTYFFRDLDAQPGLADGYLDDSARYIERYSSRIGPYPFAASAWSPAPCPPASPCPRSPTSAGDVLRLPFIRATSLGHEVLHNWWGNGVDPRLGHGQLVGGADRPSWPTTPTRKTNRRRPPARCASAGCAILPPCRQASSRPSPLSTAAYMAPAKPSATTSRPWCS